MWLPLDDLEGEFRWTRERVDGDEVIPILESDGVNGCVRTVASVDEESEFFSVGDGSDVVFADSFGLFLDQLAQDLEAGKYVYLAGTFQLVDELEEIGDAAALGGLVVPLVSFGEVFGAVDGLAVGEVGWAAFGVGVDVIRVEPAEWGLGAQVALAALLYEECVALCFGEESSVHAVVHNLAVSVHDEAPEFASQQNSECVFGMDGCAADGFAASVDVVPGDRHFVWVDV